jgi:hypothetical protein
MLAKFWVVEVVVGLGQPILTQVANMTVLALVVGVVAVVAVTPTLRVVHQGYLETQVLMFFLLTVVLVPLRQQELAVHRTMGPFTTTTMRAMVVAVVVMAQVVQTVTMVTLPLEFLALLSLMEVLEAMQHTVASALATAVRS